VKVSGFTIVRNAVKFNYPAAESIRSILPVCDEFIVNVGDSEDSTLELVKSINDPKIKIIRNKWDFGRGEVVLSEQTNIALGQCRGDWAFYLQSDEVVHEKDLPVLSKIMRRHLADPGVDALRFKWLHFYGSYYRYRIDAGWFQKEDRIIRNNGEIESYSGAFGFRRKDGRPLKRLKTKCFIYHYGWVQPPDVMTERRVNAENIGFTSLLSEERVKDYEYGDLNRFPVYFGTHPAVMWDKVASHRLSSQDWRNISGKYWWSPLRIFRMRYKTFIRNRQKLG
jgi:glycosyltransferase involved in cell wall biosynthesis